MIDQHFELGYYNHISDKQEIAHVQLITDQYLDCLDLALLEEFKCNLLELAKKN